MTTQALVRLIPNPPALVVRRNTPNEGSSLNLWIAIILSYDLTLPVSISIGTFFSQM